MCVLFLLDKAVTVMKWLEIINVCIILLLIRTTLQLKCLKHCQYTLKTSSAYYEPNKCWNTTVGATICFVELQLDYSNQPAKINRSFQQVFPSNFNTKFQTLTQLKTIIDLKYGIVYHTFTHYCTTNPYCTRAFLSDIFNTYRTKSYTVFIDKLRQLFRLNSTKAISLSPVSCINRDDMLTDCINGRCHIYESPFTDSVKLGCSIKNISAPAPVVVDVADMSEWIMFSFELECYWSLCNNKSLVGNVKNLIRSIFESPEALIVNNVTNNNNDDNVNNRIYKNDNNQIGYQFNDFFKFKYIGSFAKSFAFNDAYHFLIRLFVLRMNKNAHVPFKCVENRYDKL